MNYVADVKKDKQPDAPLIAAPPELFAGKTADKFTVLVVDDEEVFIKGLKFALESEGYQVESANNGREAIDKQRSVNASLIVMDLMMPDVDGLEACRQIRGFSDAPIIILTARDEDADKLKGFDCGADDYITKPFNLSELKARVRALLRRYVTASTVKPAVFETESISAADIVVDFRGRRVILRGSEIELASKEFDLLTTLMRDVGKVFSREELMSRVWSADTQSDVRTVDVHIRHLREKLELDPANPRLIITKWKAGYYFSG
jgi:DNA-binding response OmpR family regulator